jgi:hypothetical protein
VEDGLGLNHFGWDMMMCVGLGSGFSCPRLLSPLVVLVLNAVSSINTAAVPLPVNTLLTSCLARPFNSGRMLLASSADARARSAGSCSTSSDSSVFD